MQSKSRLNHTMTLGAAAMLALHVGAPAWAQQATRPVTPRDQSPASAPSQEKPATKEKDAKPGEAKPNEANKPSPGKELVPAPHPLISEVLFAVPSGSDGDFNKDGVRSAIGDEFIELVNPHKVAIQLKGYRIAEGQVQTRKGEQREEPAQNEGNDPKDESRLDITLPELLLQPGEVVVIFNGFDANIPQPVGTHKASAEKNELFANAYVFSFEADSKYVALSNTNDMVQLIAPDGTGVQAVSWDFRKQRTDAGSPTQSQPADASSPQKTPGTDAPRESTPQKEDKNTPGTIRSRDRAKQPAPSTKDNKPAQERPKQHLPKHADTSIALLEQINDSSWREGSVQRQGLQGKLMPHLRIDGRLASPGEFVSQQRADR